MADGSGKKEYTLIINGVEKNIQDFTKLSEAVERYDSSMQKVSQSGKEFVINSRAGTKALTDEEKAERQLMGTIDKVVRARTDANKAQIEANMAAREAQRAVTLQIKENAAAENSIERMRVQLSRMKDEWKVMDVGSEAFQQMSAEILELNNRIKEAEMSTGDFRRNVGNYESALAGIGKFSEGMEGATKSTMGLAQGLMGANSLMGLFGNESEENAERSAKLSKIIGILSIAEQVNTNILKEGIIQNKLSVVTDTIRTTQIKAKAAAEAAGTKGTIAATVAQKVFNVVASANPYVLLALALVAVGAALFAFSSNTENAAEKQKTLNELQSNYLDLLEEETKKSTQVSSGRILNLERQLKVLGAQGDKQKEIRKIEDEIAAERKRNNAYNRGFYAQEIKDLDANKLKLEEYRKILYSLQQAKSQGENELAIDIDLDGKAEDVDVEEAIEAIQGKADNLGRSVQIAVDLNTEKLDLSSEDKVLKEKRRKEDRDAAKDRAKIEIEAIRSAEDVKLKLIQDAGEQTRKQTELTYNRQIEDLRKRLSTETNLTQRARRAINEQIVNLESVKGKELKELQETQIKETLALQRSVEDSSTSLITGEFERRKTEINAQYDRQTEDYKSRLEKDKSLTDEQQKAITSLIVNAQKARDKELEKLTIEELDKRAALQLSSVENSLVSAQNKIGEVVKRDKKGLQLIDVETTRKNLNDANVALDEYINGLSRYRESLTVSHNAMLATLKEGTPEYEAEMQKYAAAMENTGKQIKDSQKEQAANTKQSSGLQGEFYKDLFGKIGEYAGEAVNVFNGVMETLNMGLQNQLDGINEQLESVNGKYEEAKKLREESAARVQELEEQLANSSGGRALALREQLENERQMRDEAFKEEQKLAKQKEKLEADKAKKEKQLKRNELISNIVMATANVAESITKALAAGPVVGQVFAGIMAAIGAVQVGIMARQLTKLAKGGEIKGPSHAYGGVPIPGTNYEAEGGEFVMNKISYGANSELVKFINDTPRAVTAFDLLGMLPGTPAPTVSSGFAGSKEDRIVEAIEKIEMRPVVAVTDVIDAMDEVTNVRDLAGM